MNNEETSDFIAMQDITDEMRIQFNIDKFYEHTENFTQKKEQIRKLKLLRNNLINMTDTYLKKYKNTLITDSFYKKLEIAKKQATNGNKINKYNQYMNEIRVVQEFKGIQDENISDKLAEQLIDIWKNSEEVEDWQPNKE